MKKIDKLNAELSNMDRRISMRENLALGFTEASKENTEKMMKMTGEIIDMLKDKQNQFMARHAAKIDQNSFELQLIKQNISRINLELSNIGIAMADLKKSVEENVNLSFRRVSEMISNIAGGHQNDGKK
jgi:hypothetical protein